MSSSVLKTTNSAESGSTDGLVLQDQATVTISQNQEYFATEAVLTASGTQSEFGDHRGLFEVDFIEPTTNTVVESITITREFQTDGGSPDDRASTNVVEQHYQNYIVEARLYVEQFDSGGNGRTYSHDGISGTVKFREVVP
jgi:hypothetical protein